MTEMSWVQTPTMETIFQAPFIWIKAWNKNVEKTLTWHCCMCCNPANGRVDFEEWTAYKIQLHGIDWIVSLSADWDQSPTKKNILKNANVYYLISEIKYVSFHPTPKKILFTWTSWETNMGKKRGKGLLW